MQFLIPATHTKGVKKTINKSKAGKRGTVSQHIMISDGGDTREEKITLNILEEDYEREEKVIHMFAINVPIDTACKFKHGEMNGPKRCRGVSVQMINNRYMVQVYRIQET